MIRTALLVSTVLAAVATAETPAAPSAPPAAHRMTAQADGGLEYWVYLPEGYDQRDDWPLLIFLHGRGQVTMDNLFKYGPPRQIEAGMDLPFVVVAPLSPNGEWWKTDRLIVFTDTVAGKYKIDLRRIYLTGISMGGFGSWSLACEYPSRFAAVAPICGGGNPQRAGRLKDVPVWAFHGKLDKTVRIDQSQRMVDALKAAGGNVQFTVYENEAHVCWPRVYDSPTFYDWLLAQRRAEPADVERFAALNHELDTGTHLRTLPLLTDRPHVTPMGVQFTLVNNTGHAGVARLVLAEHAQLNLAPKQLRVPLPAHGQGVARVSLEPKKQIAPADVAPIDVKWAVQFDVPDARKFSYNYAREYRIWPLHPCPRAGAVTVDGNLADWPDDQWIAVTEPTQIIRQTDAHHGPDDCAFGFQTAHDQRYVYVAVQVRDDKLVLDAAKPVWAQDGVEVRLDARPEDLRGDSAVDWDDVLPILVSPATEGGEQVMWDADKLPVGTQVHCTADGKGYNLELAVPAAYFVEKGGDGWRGFRLNVAVNDFDGGDKGPQLWWQTDWRGGDGDAGSGTFRK